MFKLFNNLFTRCQKQIQKQEGSYNKWHDEEIRKGKEMGIDVSVYNNPILKPYEMEAARKALISGASPNIVKKIVDAYANSEFEEKRYDKLMACSAYVIDIDFIKNKYHIADIPDEEPKPFKRDVIYGTVYGDIAGSQYEFCFSADERTKLDVDNCIGIGSSFTDDTVLTCATADVLNENWLEISNYPVSFDDFRLESTYPFTKNPFAEKYREYTLKFPGAGYGPGFYEWAIYNHDCPYGSLGNGAAMRVSPVGAYLNDIDDVILWALASSAATHNHPEGIKGAVVTAVCVWMALHGFSKHQIYHYMWDKYKDGPYGFKNFSMDELHHPAFNIRSDATCMFSVPAAVICFYYSSSFDEMINNVLSFFGDTDTIGAIAGGIGAAYYGITDDKKQIVENLKPKHIFDEAINIFDTQ